MVVSRANKGPGKSTGKGAPHGAGPFGLFDTVFPPGFSGFQDALTSWLAGNGKASKHSLESQPPPSPASLTEAALSLSSTPTVSTDKADYAPGETVTITASGFTVGGTVQFSLQDDAVLYGDDGDQDVYKSFTATDGGKGDADGLANGVIVTSWKVPPKDAVNALVHLTAEDVFTGEVATTSFTDAPGSTNKVYQHWADGDAATGSTPEWNNNILSANKSDYFEGEVIPHVFVYKASNQAPLVNGQSYSFTITYNYYQNNTDAGGFAYITTYDISRQPGQLGATNPPKTPAFDSNGFTNDGGFTSGTGKQGSSGFYTVDADVTGVSGVT